MKGKRFSLDLMEEKQAADLSSVNITELGHKIMTHFNHVALLNMKKHIILEGFPSLSNLHTALRKSMLRYNQSNHSSSKCVFKQQT